MSYRYEKGKLRVDRGEFIDKGNYAFDPRHEDFGGGADPEGLKDSYHAFKDCDAEALAVGGNVRPSLGTYRIANDITLSAGWDLPEGVVIRPDNGVTVTFAGRVRGMGDRGTQLDTSAGGSFTVAGPEWFYGASGFQGTVLDRGGATFNVMSFDAKGDGVADDRAAFVACEAAGDDCTAPAGTYLVSSNLTLSKRWSFRKGAIIKPASGVTVTINGAFEAGLYQCFDLSLGGSVVFNAAAIVNAEWWGTGATALSSALAAIADDGGVVRAQTTLSTATTLQIQDGCSLIVDSEAAIEPSADVDVVQIMRGGFFSGRINLDTVPGFSKAGILVDGGEVIGSAGHITVGSDIIIDGNSSNRTGIGMHFKSLNDGDAISFLQFNVVKINDVDTAIKMERSGTGYVNGNVFTNLLISRCIHHFDIGDGCDGNVFIAPHVQTTQATEKVIECSGDYNQWVGLFFWDWDAADAGWPVAVEFGSGSFGNFVIGANIDANMVSDLGVDNRVVSSGDNPVLQRVPIAPRGAERPRFAGDQDDFLAFAYELGTVTRTAGTAPTGGDTSLANIFDLDLTNFAGWTNTSTLPVTIEVELPTAIQALYALGVQFVSSERAAGTVSIDVHDGANWQNLVSVTGNTKLEVVGYASSNTSTPSSFSKVRFTIDDLGTSGTIRVSRFWGLSQRFPGKSWMPTKNPKILVPEYADNAAALAGGLVAGDVYHASGALRVVT